jgi:hypothetical protein
VDPVITDTTKLVVDDQHPIINMNDPLIKHDDPFFKAPGPQHKIGTCLFIRGVRLFPQRTRRLPK